MKVVLSVPFLEWLRSLRDSRAIDRIAKRLLRLDAGHFGDVKYFSGIGELRIDYGPGYRLYFVEHKGDLVVLLHGGDKDSQDRDIATALRMAKELRNDH